MSFRGINTLLYEKNNVKEEFDVGILAIIGYAIVAIVLILVAAVLLLPVLVAVGIVGAASLYVVGGWVLGVVLIVLLIKWLASI